MTKGELLEKVADYYLRSGDYNGFQARTLGIPEEHTKSLLKELIREELVSLNFGDGHPNSHINAFGPEPLNDQIRKIDDIGLDRACIYPSPLHLSYIIKKDDYVNRPFTLRLCLGEPQLKFFSFDLSILELYRNDPRYHYDVNDIHGSIGVIVENQMHECNQIYLQTFGFPMIRK